MKDTDNEIVDAMFPPNKLKLVLDDSPINLSDVELLKIVNHRGGIGCYEYLVQLADLSLVWIPQSQFNTLKLITDYWLKVESQY